MHTHIFQRENFGKNSTVTCVTYSIEIQPVCFEDEKRPRVCLPSPSLKKVFRQAEDDSSVSWFVLPKSVRLEMDDCCDCDCTGDEPVGIGFRASFSPTFEFSKLPAILRELEPVRLFEFALGASDHIPFGSQPTNCFSSLEKGFIDSPGKYFRNG